MGPSTEASPSKTSPQNTIQRHDWLSIMTVLRLSHQENPASCPSKLSSKRTQVICVCSLDMQLPDFVRVLVTPSQEMENILTGCDIKQSHGPRCQRVPERNPS